MITSGNLATAEVTQPTITTGPTKLTIAASADTLNQALISAPGADKQIWVLDFHLTVNTSGTVRFQDEDDAVPTGSGTITTGTGIVVPWSGDYAVPSFKVATNKALEIDTVTCSAGGGLTYIVVDVS